MDPLVLAPVVATLAAAGGALGGLYFAGPRKNSLIATAAETAVDAVTKSIGRQTAELERQQAQLVDQQTQLGIARSRITALEGELDRTREATAVALRTSSAATAQALSVSQDAIAEALRVANDRAKGYEDRIDGLRAEVTRLGGQVEMINRPGTTGDPGPTGPPGPQGPPGDSASHADG